MILRKRKPKLCIIVLLFLFLLLTVLLSISNENKSLKTKIIPTLTVSVQSSISTHHTPVQTERNKVNLNQNNLKVLESPVAPIDWLKEFGRANLTDSRVGETDRILLLDGIAWWKESLESFKDCPLSCEFIEENNLDYKSMSSYKTIIIVRDMFHSTIIDQSILLNSNTKLIYYTLEAPQSSHGLKITGNAMLASYWRGSDFWTPYVKWKATRSKKQDREIKKISSNSTKTRLAVAVISNCVTRNDREWLIAELNRYIKVDVFGKCGNHSCDLPLNSTCFDEIPKMYKFYLAFENTNCRDYITEKYFRSILELGMIPVVMGAPKIDYETLGPKDSFIHIDDFQSPQDLAEYLILLDNNDTAYKEYFRWNRESLGQVESTYFLCEVCAMVKLSHYVPIRSRLANGFQWIAENTDLCLPSGQWNWNK